MLPISAARDEALPYAKECKETQLMKNGASKEDVSKGDQICNTELLAKASEEPEEEGQRDAEEEAGNDREVEGGVLAAVNDVAGEFANAERKLATEIKEGAEENQERTHNKKGAAEFAKRIHEEILEEMK